MKSSPDSPACTKRCSVVNFSSNFALIPYSTSWKTQRSEQFPAKQNKIKREKSLKPEKLSDRYFKKISVKQNKIKSKEKQA
jgi:hypothetical protein